MLKEAGVWDKTIIILTADHGENLGEHPVPPPYYPQHRDLYECTIKIPLIIKAPSLQKGQRVKGLVRTIDIVPTVYEALGIKGVETEGINLAEIVKKGTSENVVSYAEELYQRRGYGDFQSLKSDVYKYIVDRRSGKEEFFNIKKDPGEKNNLIGKLLDEERKVKDEWRKICDKLVVRRKSSLALSDKQREQIEKRLKALGYQGGQ
jgi:arylsulfatase A-like enzyme